MAQQGTQNIGVICKKVAQWNDYRSNIFLEELRKQKDSVRRGDNGLRREQWLQIAKVMKEECNMDLNLQQVKNHYKVWRLRLKAISTLRNTSGMGFEGNRFSCTQDIWDSLTKANKEIKYWVRREITPTHEELLRWFIDEDASGSLTTSVIEQIENLGTQNEEPTFLLDDSAPVIDEMDETAPEPDPVQSCEPSSAPTATTATTSHTNTHGLKRKRSSKFLELAEEMGSIRMQIGRLLEAVEEQNEIQKEQNEIQKEQNEIQRKTQLDPVEVDAILIDLDEEVGTEVCMKASDYFIENAKAIPVFIKYSRAKQIHWLLSKFK